ncbi:MAG: FAD-binding oxidoreductase [Candidatus Thorarchaeota archaeon]|nr:FAD-binding oxidoreductase [Candidatus Thorarchaeota archaeon]
MTVVKASASHPLYNELLAIVGQDRVNDNQVIISAYSKDACHLVADRPGIVVMPNNVEEVQKIVRLCAKTKTPIMPAGGRNGICGACLPRVPNTVLLDMINMKRLVKLDEEVMTVTVEAGMRWAELIHILEDRGYKLGFRGPYGGNAATVAGSVSINSMGYAASKFGPAPEGVVSLEVVLPDGEIVRTGSAWNKEAQTFTRYSSFADLTGVFLGDHGTLGVKTKVTLKIYPKAPFSTYIDLGFKTLEDATAVLLEIQKRGLTEELNCLLARESADTYFPGLLDSHPGINATIHSVVMETDQQLAERKVQIIREIGLEMKGKDIGNFAAQIHWAEKFNEVQPMYNNGFWLNTCHLRPIVRLPELMNRMRDIFKKYNLEKNGIKWIADALAVDRAYSAAWVTIFAPTRDKMEFAERAWNEMLDAAIETGGCPYWTGLLWENRALKKVDENFIELYRTIKRAIDPDNIMAPNVFQGGY